MNNNKEPWFAFAVAMFVPGSGLAYLGNYAIATILFISTIGIGFIGLLILKSEDIVGMYGWMFLGLSAALHLTSAGLTYMVARRKNTLEFESDRKSRKDPHLSYLLSFIWPGFGHIYSRRDIGYLIAVYYAVFAYALADHLPKILVVAVVILISIHAFAITRDKSRQSLRRRNVLIGLSSVALLLLKSRKIIAIAIFGYHLSVGPSMEPTIANGDLILYNNVDGNHIHRGDIVSIKHSEKFDRVSVVKRLIGLPGDTIEISHGLISINRLQIERPIQFSDTAFDGTILVPADSIYVLGDNPAMSQDSRDVGFIPIAAVKEVAYKIFWPINRMTMLRSSTKQH